MAAAVKRLHIGGLFDTVAEDDLRQRLSKHGEVSSVEIVVRRDSDGKPMKTFAYVDISVTEAELKKCMNTYNGSKWKGSVMSIQLAKQSFLHKLQSERDQTKKNEISKSAKNSPEMSHDKVRVQMEKGLKPTNTPEDEKKWVVGRSGKVLPVVNIRQKDKKKVITVDPTKYERGIKNLEKEEDEREVTKSKVTQLTWALDEKKSENHKKRMGEFPAYTPPKKRKSNLASNGDNDFEVVSLDTAHSADRNSGSFVTSGYNSDSSSDQFSTETSRQGPLPDIIKSTRLSAKMFKKFNSSDSESDEEIVENVKHNPEHKFMKSENKKLSLPSTTQRTSNVKKTINKTQQERFNQPDSGSESDTPMTSLKKKGKRDLVSSVKSFSKKDEGNDNVQNRKLHEDKVHTTKPVGRLPEFRGTAMLDLVAKTSVGKTTPKHQFDGVKYGADILADLFASESSSEESSDAEHNIKDRNTDVPDFTNVQGAIDSMLGLKEGVERNPESNRKARKKVKTDRIEDLDSKVESVEESEPEQSNTIKVTTDRQCKPEGSGSDDIESSDSETESDTKMSESDDDDDDGEKSISSTTKVQKIQPVKKDERDPKEMKTSYTSDSSDSEVKSNDNLKEKSPSTKEFPKYGSGIPKQSSNRKDFLSNVSVISEFSSGLVETKDKKHKRDDFSDSEEDLLDMVKSGKMKKIREFEKKAMDDITGKKGKGINKVRELENGEKDDKAVGDKKQLVESGRPKSKDAEKSKCNDDAKISERKPKTKLQKHALDNQRRMESMRQKEQEIRNHKATIKKALASIDSKGSSSNKIIFDSDSDEEIKAEVTATTTKMPPENKSESDSSGDSDSDSNKQMSKKSAGALFSDSDEADNDDEDKERFRIRPEFEGKSGSKLLSMQRRFEGDDRFKMDAKFVEEDDNSDIEEDALKTKERCDNVDGDLLSEKQKSLQILGDVLGSTQVKQPKRAKIFKDMSTLHYDPTREDHQQFEIKPDTKDGEPAKKKKKKKMKEEKIEESLPEVSGEKFFEIDPSFRNLMVSQKTKDDKKMAEDENMGDEEPKELELTNEKPFSLLSLFGKAEEIREEESRDVGTDLPNYDKPAVLPKQPRFGGFHDDDYSDAGSSDNEESEMDTDEPSKQGDDAKDSSSSFTRVDRFFFSQNDPRIQEGIAFFQRDEDPEELRRRWAEKRPQLVQAYRMKRKAQLRKDREAQRLKKKTFGIKKAK